MSLSSSNRISRNDGRGVNAYDNMKNENNGNPTNYVLNNNRNETMNEENTIQNEIFALERRTDRELKHKGNLEETKKGGSM